MFRDYEILLLACWVSTLLQLSLGDVNAAMGTVLGYTFALLLDDRDEPVWISVASERLSRAA